MLARIDNDPAAAAHVGVEYGIAAGYAAWWPTYDRPLRLFASKRRRCAGCSTR